MPTASQSTGVEPVNCTIATLPAEACKSLKPSRCIYLLIARVSNGVGSIKTCKAISTYEEPRNMKLIIFIRKAKLNEVLYLILLMLSLGLGCVNLQEIQGLIWALCRRKDDLKAVIDYLWVDGNVSMIGLWCRSIGAVTRYGLMEMSL
ncbi:hypothetical protein WN943_023655 [Citrus x changshan-huyou]